MPLPCNRCFRRHRGGEMPMPPCYWKRCWWNLMRYCCNMRRTDLRLLWRNIRLPTATTARRYCCCATAKPCSKARLKAWTDKAFCAWKRQRANRRSSAAKSACGPTTDRFPCRSGGIRYVFCCWTAATASSSGRGWKTARSQPSVARRTAICRLWARSGRKGGWKCPHRRLRCVRRIQKGTSAGTARLKNRVAAVFGTGFGHTQPLPPPRRTRFRPLVQRLGQPPLQPQRLRRRQLRHGGNG